MSKLSSNIPLLASGDSCFSCTFNLLAVLSVSIFTYLQCYAQISKNVKAPHWMSVTIMLEGVPSCQDHFAASVEMVLYCLILMAKPVAVSAHYIILKCGLNPKTTLIQSTMYWHNDNGLHYFLNNSQQISVKFANSQFDYLFQFWHIAKIPHKLGVQSLLVYLSMVQMLVSVSILRNLRMANVKMSMNA